MAEQNAPRNRGAELRCKKRVTSIESAGERMYFFSKYESPLGWLTLASDGEALCGLWIEGQKHFGHLMVDDAVRDQCAMPFPDCREWLDAYFAGANPPLGVFPLAAQGTDFQMAVWQCLCEIPYGQVVSYGEIAKEIASRQGKERGSALAVGGAVGHNPISIIIPCHRVVGADGSLTGYAGGLERKEWLLRHEGVDMSRLHMPKADAK